DAVPVTAEPHGQGAAVPRQPVLCLAQRPAYGRREVLRHVTGHPAAYDRDRVDRRADRARERLDEAVDGQGPELERAQGDPPRAGPRGQLPGELTTQPAPGLGTVGDERTAVPGAAAG